MGELTPAQASALSLLLRHEQSYDDLGRRLRIDPMSVRARAHEGAAVLAGLEPGAAADGPLIDQALGQLPIWEAEPRFLPFDDPDQAWKLERLTEALKAFVAPGLRPVPTPADATIVRPVVTPAEAAIVRPVVTPAEATIVRPVPTPAEATIVRPVGTAVARRPSPEAGTALARRHTSVAGTAIVRRPRSRSSPRRAVVVRMGAMLSLGLGSLAAGGILFINGAH